MHKIFSILIKCFFFFFFFAIVTLDMHCLIGEKIKNYGNVQERNPVTHTKEWQLMFANNIDTRQ